MTLPGDLGSFVPTTDIIDVGSVEELIVQLSQVLNNISLVLNTKDTGIYSTEEFVNGQLWFRPTTPLSGQESRERQVYRKVIDFGALPNSAVKSVAHGIPVTSDTKFTRIYGTANDTAAMTYLPLPFVGTAINFMIRVTVDATNVNITTGSNRTNYTTTYIVLEYIQD